MNISARPSKSPRLFGPDGPRAYGADALDARHVEAERVLVEVAVAALGAAETAHDNQPDPPGRAGLVPARVLFYQPEGARPRPLLHRLELRGDAPLPPLAGRVVEEIEGVIRG